MILLISVGGSGSGHHSLPASIQQLLLCMYVHHSSLVMPESSILVAKHIQWTNTRGVHVGLLRSYGGGKGKGMAEAFTDHKSFTPGRTCSHLNLGLILALVLPFALSLAFKFVPQLAWVVVDTDGFWCFEMMLVSLPLIWSAWWGGGGGGGKLFPKSRYQV